jgi:predicted permease
MILPDLRHALRRLARSPGFSATVILLVAFALGANASVFSVIYGLLYKPLPYPGQERLVSIDTELVGFGHAGVSVPLLDQAARTTTLQGVAAYRPENLALRDDDGRRLAGFDVARVQPGVMTLLGARPALGRLFADEDATEGAARTAILSWDTWQQRFAGDAGVLGRTLRLGEDTYRVVGVLAAGFDFPTRSTQAWLPLHLAAEEHAPRRAGHFDGLFALARLAPQASAAAAGAELASLARGMDELKKGFDAGQIAVGAVPLRDLWVGQKRSALELMLVAVAMVLLVTAANVCNLFIARGLQRRREGAIMEALGAGAWRRTRQLLIEALLVCGAGALGGAVLLPAGLHLLRHFELLPADTPQAVGIDAPTWAFMAVLALLLAAAITLSGLGLRRGGIHAALRQGGLRQTAGRGAQRARQTLIVAQIALTAALLVGVGLLLRSSQQLLAEDLGFARDGLVVAGLGDLVPAGADARTRLAAQEALLQQAKALPGVAAAGIGSMAPFGDDVSVANFTPPAREDVDPQPTAYRIFVDADYFRALGATLLRGRAFTPEETRAKAPVAIVDERFVQRYVGERDPIGQRLRIGAGAGAPMRELTIVGVVATLKQRALDEPGDRSAIFQPDANPPGGTLLLRAHGSAQGLVGPLGDLMLRVSPQASPGAIAAMGERIDDTLRDRRRLTLLLQVLGATALALATVGLYAVLAYAVRMRRGEFGVRLALGASGARVQRQVLGQGLALVGAGLALGLPLAAATARLLADELYRVGGYDPPTLAAVAVLLALVGVAACWLPARRAAGIDPAVALRNE